MVNRTVKLKFPVSGLLSSLAIATFLASFIGLFPSQPVEKWFARGLFPTISHIMAPMADAFPFSLLDLLIPVVLALVIYGIRYKRWRMVLGFAATLYLWFFWTWGLNYHRLPIEVRLGLPSRPLDSGQTDDLAQMAAAELNRLYGEEGISGNPQFPIAARASERVRRVVTKIDGEDFAAPSVIKRSLIAERWFQIAGIEGMFNPFGHEPLVTSGLLDIELPFVMSHEFAHVRGIADEGDANLVALLATVASSEPAFQYSGWLYLWLHLSSAERNALLNAGPAADLRAVYDRMRLHRIEWAGDIQSAVLDMHLKTNDVDEGVASYSRVIALAIASRDRWDTFR